MKIDLQSLLSNFSHKLGICRLNGLNSPCGFACFTDIVPLCVIIFIIAIIINCILMNSNLNRTDYFLFFLNTIYFSINSTEIRQYKEQYKSMKKYLYIVFYDWLRSSFFTKQWFQCSIGAAHSKISEPLLLGTFIFCSQLCLCLWLCCGDLACCMTDQWRQSGDSWASQRGTRDTVCVLPTCNWWRRHSQNIHTGDLGN